MTAFPQAINASASPEVQTNENFLALQALGTYSHNAVADSGLVRGYSGGRWGGFAVADVAHTFAASTTTYVSVKRADGSLDFNISSTHYNDATNYAKVETVVTGSSAVTAVIDDRVGPGGVLGAIGTGGVGSDTIGATGKGVNLQTGTSYTSLTGDAGKDNTFANASAIAVTLAQAGSTGFAAGWSAIYRSTGNGAVTITPATSTIEGAATLVLRRGDWAVVTSDGANYDAAIVRRASRGVTALIDASTVTIDASVSDDFRLIATSGVGSTRALGNPSNLVDGQKINVRWTQDATGGRALTFASKWKLVGSAVTLITTTGALVLISGQYDATDDTIAYAMQNVAS